MTKSDSYGSAVSRKLKDRHINMLKRSKLFKG